MAHDPLRQQLPLRLVVVILIPTVLLFGLIIAGSLGRGSWFVDQVLIGPKGAFAFLWILALLGATGFLARREKARNQKGESGERGRR